MSEVSNEDILDAIHAFSGAIDGRFLSVDKRFDRIESTMVTKDYLDEKLWDLRGDMVRMMDRRVHKHENQFHPV